MPENAFVSDEPNLNELLVEMEATSSVESEPDRKWRKRPARDLEGAVAGAPPAPDTGPSSSGSSEDPGHASSACEPLGL